MEHTIPRSAIVKRRKSPAFDKVHWVYNAYMLLSNRYNVNRITRMLDLKGDERILDIGGGTGYLAKRLAPLCNEIYVIDKSPRMLSHVESRIQVTQGDALDTPFADSFFDVALLTDVFHHIADQPQLIREAHRVVKPGGKLLIHDSDGSHWQVPIASFFEQLFVGKVYKRTRTYAEELFRSTGFEELDKVVWGKQYIIVWRKK
jgi:ubiquinone/menaquinone biosynthesis C-methylase UbiE